MKIEKNTLNGNEYKLFKDVEVFANTDREEIIPFVAEARLANDIFNLIKQNRYTQDVEEIDDLYYYFVPQEIANTDNEQTIAQSVEDAINDKC